MDSPALPSLLICYPERSLLRPLAVPGPPGPVSVSGPDKQRVDATPVIRPGQEGEPRTLGVVGSGPGVCEGGHEHPAPPDSGGVGVHHQAEPEPRRGQDIKLLSSAPDFSGTI